MHVELFLGTECFRDADVNAAAFSPGIARFTCKTRARVAGNPLAGHRKEIALSWFDSRLDETRPLRGGKSTQIRKNCLHSRPSSGATACPWLRVVFQGGKRSGRNLGKLSYARWSIVNHLSSRLVPITDPPPNYSIAFVLPGTISASLL